MPLPLILSVSFADDCGIAMKGGKPAFVETKLVVAFDDDDDGRTSACGGIAAMIGSFGTVPTTAIICGDCGEQKYTVNYRDEQTRSVHTLHTTKI